MTNVGKRPIVDAGRYGKRVECQSAPGSYLPLYYWRLSRGTSASDQLMGETVRIWLRGCPSMTAFGLINILSEMVQLALLSSGNLETTHESSWKANISLTTIANR